MRKGPVLAVITGLLFPPVMGRMITGDAKAPAAIETAAAEPQQVAATTRSWAATQSIAPAPAPQRADDPCVRFASQVQVPKRTSVMDSMEEKYAQAIKSANDRLLAVRKCLLHGHR